MAGCCRGAGDVPGSADAREQFAKNFLGTFAAFFRKPQIGTLIVFLLLYRFGEAQLLTVAKLFLLDPREKGGVALSDDQFGWIYGHVGVGALLVGGLLGGFVVSRHGLKFWLWPMLLAIHLPDAVFVWLACTQPENIFAIGAGVAIEQFGYGFGFTAFMLYMIYIARGEHQTAHYAICTGFMALGMMLPGHVERLVAGTHWLSTFLRVGAAGDDSEFYRRPANSARGGVWPAQPGRLNQLPKRIALNPPAFPESKFTMKSIRFHHFGRGLAGALLAMRRPLIFCPPPTLNLSSPIPRPG